MLILFDEQERDDISNGVPKCADNYCRNEKQIPGADEVTTDDVQKLR
jgi:hypothetical protein